MGALMAGRRELLLHIGLPKTASTALQTWADLNRQLLLNHGIHYPAPSKGSYMPKHQDLVPGLQSGDLACLDRYLAAAEAPVLFLSTEGLSNHLYDYPSTSLSAFREKLVGWKVRLLMMKRSPEKWLTSLWKQRILNPRMPGTHFATPLKRDEFAMLPEVRRLADFEQVIADARVAYGAEETTVGDHGSDWFAVLRALLGLPEDIAPPPRVHISVSEDLAEIVRQVNATVPDNGLRILVLAFIQHSLATRHSEMIKYATARPLAEISLHADAIDRTLAGIIAVTQGQADLLAGLIEKQMALEAMGKP
jgi:hypothetical protein